MKDTRATEFQSKVAELLVRHKSILDTLSKLQESSATVNRSVCKAVTSCGCLSVKAGKQAYPPDISLKECKDFASAHLEGHLCEVCREIISEKLGNNLFYMVALCNLLDFDLDELINKELQRLNTMGHFNLS